MGKFENFFKSVEQEFNDEQFIDVDFNKYDTIIKNRLAEAAACYVILCMAEISDCESPIEQLFALELYGLHGSDWGLSFHVSNQKIIETCDGKFRVDFFISASYENKTSYLIVECDGHDFHEKTKAQAARDKKRDRALKMAGYDVIHFTGSEIWKNAQGCALETIKMLLTICGCGGV